MDKETQMPTLSKTAVSKSVLLTGKCKSDFENWLENQNVAPYKVMFWDIPKIVQCAYITEWLDTNGYFIEITKDNERINTHVNGQWISGNYKSRMEAMKFTMDIVNEMYNENVV
jgi:hypothetical protein